MSESISPKMESRNFERVLNAMEKKVIVRGYLDPHHTKLAFFICSMLGGVEMIASYSISKPWVGDPEFDVWEREEFGGEDALVGDLINLEGLRHQGTLTGEQIFVLNHHVDPAMIEPPGSTRLRDHLVWAMVILVHCLETPRRIEPGHVELFKAMQKRIEALLKEQNKNRQHAIQMLIEG